MYYIAMEASCFEYHLIDQRLQHQALYSIVSRLAYEASIYEKSLNSCHTKGYDFLRREWRFFTYQLVMYIFKLILER